MSLYRRLRHFDPLPDINLFFSLERKEPKVQGCIAFTRAGSLLAQSPLKSNLLFKPADLSASRERANVLNTFEPARELQLSHKPSLLKAKDFNEKFYEAASPEPVNRYA